MFCVIVSPLKFGWAFTKGSRGTCGFEGRVFNMMVASSSACILSWTGIGSTTSGLSSWWLWNLSIIGCWGNHFNMVCKACRTFQFGCKTIFNRAEGYSSILWSFFNILWLSMYILKLLFITFDELSLSS